jgi:Ser/Thr protein kinase RdoA (MazF antagonist)
LKNKISVAARQFEPQGIIRSIQVYGQGNIQDTYLVILNGMTGKKFLLQRMNTGVFPKPKLVLQNMRVTYDHVMKQLPHSPLTSSRRWEIPHVLLTHNGQDHWIGPDGSFWRALSFIDQARSFEAIQDSAHAREVGFALGMFHRLMYNLPIETLADTLEGYHITPGYLRHYDTVLAKINPPKSPEVDYGLEFVNRRRIGVDILEKAKVKGIIKLRPIHGDPKVNNVLIDIHTRQAVSLVDLDTVKPGLIHYDMGDCLRSCCNPLGEETEQWETVRFEPDLCREILKGYLSMAGQFLTANDHQYLFQAIRLIAFELGLRFFTDYLEGNIYFRVGHEEQNLNRALVQFRLTESIESQESILRALIEELR